MIELALPDLGPPDTLRAVRGLAVFPVRHHSPLASRMLRQRVKEHPPRLVLIEGPADASVVISMIADPSNEPPLAMLAYRTGQARASYTYPYAPFSPEYQAMCIARELGVPARYFDVPLACRLAPGMEPEPEAPPPPPLEPQAADRIGARLGSLWEVEFEARKLTLPEYIAAALELGRQMSAPGVTGLDPTWNRTREAYMMATAWRAVEAGVAPEDVLIVCGAAHASPLLEGDVDFSLLARLARPVEVSAFLVPYSYPRLSAYLGYRAGLLFPGFSQAIWDADGDVEEAVCRVINEVGGGLRKQGYAPSLADAIDGMVLAKNLAALRGLAAPGVPELVQAVESCLTRGRFARARDAVHRCLVGDRVGRLAGDAGRSPLALEFYSFVTHARHSPPLLVSDRALPVHLDLHAEAHREISTFLHRLALARLPYATRGADTGGWSEDWRVSWSPALDLRLAVACEEGLSIEEVAHQHVTAQLAELHTVREAAALYLDTVRAALPVVPAVRAAVDRLCVESDDVPDLCEATWRLHHLVRYEGLSAERAADVHRLFHAVAARALLGIGALRQLADEEARQLTGALPGFVDIRAALDDDARALLATQLVTLSGSRAAHPLVAGAACGLALLCGHLTVAQVSAEVAGRLCGVGTEEPATWFLEGLFAHQRRELVSTKALARELRAFVERLPEREFVRLLPALRRTFGSLERGDTEVLLSQVATCRGDGFRRRRRAGRRALAPRADRAMVNALDRLARELTGGRA